MNKYNEKEYIKNLKLKTLWKPDKDFYNYCFNEIFKLTFVNEGWWERERAFEKILKGFDFQKIAYFWNTMPEFRSEILSTVISADKSKCDKESALEFLRSVNNVIPDNFDIHDVKLRIRLAKVLGVENINVLDQITKAKLVGLDNIANVWTEFGMHNSSDPNLFSYMWSSVKREPGSVDKKIEIIKSSLGNQVYCDKIVSDSASKGTKRIKRAASTCLAEWINNLTYSRDRIVRKKDPAFDGLIKVKNDELAFLEEKILLFANTDDSEVVECLMRVLSVDNLPWIMPSAGKFPWLLRRIQRRIDDGN